MNRNESLKLRSNNIYFTLFSIRISRLNFLLLNPFLLRAYHFFLRLFVRPHAKIAWQEFKALFLYSIYKTLTKLFRYRNGMKFNSIKRIPRAILARCYTSE